MLSKKWGAKMNKEKFYPLVDKIIAYEGGELSDNDTIELFAELVKNGMAWSLQGCYGRTAKALIDNGYISDKGEILKEIGG
jgi:hypothetical protein